MEQLQINHLTFAYEGTKNASLKDISTAVKKGEFVLVIGESGCGKTTLLRHMKVELLPPGNRSGDSEIKVCGKSVEELTGRELAGYVGFVRQNPETSQVTDKVWHELAFGMESLGYPQEVMQRKLAEMTAFFGLEDIYEEKLCNLSGGQKQLVNLAAVMVMEPEILVLDEPTSQLDPIAATQFFQIVERIHREIGTTIVMTEHRLEEVYGICDRVWFMEHGRIQKQGTPLEVALFLWKQTHPMFEALPAATRLYLQLQSESAGEPEGEIPFTVARGRTWLEGEIALGHLKKQSIDRLEQKESGGHGRLAKQTAFEADELWFRYGDKKPDVLKACSLSPVSGRILAIMGGNGAGKSTLLRVLAGCLSPVRGTVRKKTGTMAMMPQNPQAMFAQDTVQEELTVSAGEHGENRIAEQITFWDLQEVSDRHPFDLSGGQMQKLAMAKLLLSECDILLLDEPGKGLDYPAKCRMGECLQRLAQAGKTIVMVSHDVEFCARYADDCGLFFEGHIVSVMESESFFLQNAFYTTSVVRMCRNYIENAVLVRDVLECFGVAKAMVYREQERERTFDDRRETDFEESCEPEKPLVPLPKRRKKQHITSGTFIVFLIMPLTIYVGHAVLQQRKYYFISLLLLLEALGAFFLSFEKRKPGLRQVMVIAVMSAVTVAGRAAFYMIPDVKPMAALTILSGIGLGGEAGFLVGALSMLVSNIFFGQGPWTPWQMVAMGMLGYLAGCIFLPDTPCCGKKRLGICLFGFLSVLLVYGGIMNPASVIMYQDNVNREMLLTSYSMGFPFDLIHAGGTVIFLWIGAKPILKKLQRTRFFVQ